MRAHPVTVSFRLPEPLARELKARASEGRVSASEIARQVLGQSLGVPVPASRLKRPPIWLTRRDS